MQYRPWELGISLLTIGSSLSIDAQELSHAEMSYDCFGAIDAKIARWRPDSQDLSFLAAPSLHGLRFRLLDAWSIFGFKC